MCVLLPAVPLKLVFFVELAAGSETRSEINSIFSQRDIIPGTVEDRVVDTYRRTRTRMRERTRHRSGTGIFKKMKKYT